MASSGSEDGLWESCSDDSSDEKSSIIRDTTSASKAPARMDTEAGNNPELPRSMPNAVPRKLHLDLLAESGFEKSSDKPLPEIDTLPQGRSGGDTLLLQGDNEYQLNQLFRAALTYSKAIAAESRSENPAKDIFEKAIGKIAHILHEKLVDIVDLSQPFRHASDSENERERHRPPPPPAALKEIQSKDDQEHDKYVMNLERIARAANRMNWPLGPSAVEVFRAVADYCNTRVYTNDWGHAWRVHVYAASLYHRLLQQKDMEFDFVRDEEIYLLRKLGKCLLDSWPWDRLKGVQSISLAECSKILERYRVELGQSENLNDLINLASLARLYLQGEKWMEFRLQGEDIALRLYKIFLQTLGPRHKETKWIVLSLVNFYMVQEQLLEATSILEEVLLQNKDIRTITFKSSADIDWTETRKSGGEDVLIETTTIDWELAEYIDAHYSYQKQLMSLGATSGSNIYWKDSRLYLRQIDRVDFEHRSYEDPLRHRYGISEFENSSIGVLCPYVSYEMFQQSPFWKANLTYVDVAKEECSKLHYGGGSYQFEAMMRDAKQRDSDTEISTILVEEAETKVCAIERKFRCVTRSSHYSSSFFAHICLSMN